jgi:hypothetical protein
VGPRCLALTEWRCTCGQVVVTGGLKGAGADAAARAAWQSRGGEIGGDRLLVAERAGVVIRLQLRSTRAGCALNTTQQRGAERLLRTADFREERDPHCTGTCALWQCRLCGTGEARRRPRPGPLPRGFAASV